MALNQHPLQCYMQHLSYLQVHYPQTSGQANKIQFYGGIKPPWVVYIASSHLLPVSHVCGPEGHKDK